MQVNLRAILVDFLLFTTHSCGSPFSNGLTSNLMENIQTFKATDAERGILREDLGKQHEINTNAVIP